MAGPGFGDEGTDKDFRILSRGELEDEIERRTEYLSNVMDTMVDVLMRLDAEGRIEMTNSALADILGYERDTVRGKPVDFLFASPDENEELSDMLTQGELFDRLLSRGYVTDVEVQFATSEGAAIPMSLSASVIENEGRPEGIVCVAKDISERKAAEESAEFLHSLLRHDLGNKLQVIQGYMHILEEVELPDHVEEHVRMALTGIDEATELIENVRTMSQIEGEPEVEPVDLTRAVRESVQRHEDLARQKDIEVENGIDEPLAVQAGSILKELFANLVENSLKHSEADHLRVWHEHRGDEVVVVVEDDGTGIPDDRKSEIVKKGVSGLGSSGSGLGMHLVNEIAETYGGSLEVNDSELGGARFDVTLRTA